MIKNLRFTIYYDSSQCDEEIWNPESLILYESSECDAEEIEELIDPDPDANPEPLIGVEENEEEPIMADELEAPTTPKMNPPPLTNPVYLGTGLLLPPYVSQEFNMSVTKKERQLFKRYRPQRFMTSNIKVIQPKLKLAAKMALEQVLRRLLLTDNLSIL